MRRVWGIDAERGKHRGRPERKTPRALEPAAFFAKAPSGGVLQRDDLDDVLRESVVDLQDPLHLSQHLLFLVVDLTGPRVGL